LAGIMQVFERSTVEMTDNIGVTEADFTPNPGRAIWIDGEINRALESRLRPQIIELTSCSRAPITVFIDSYGGNGAVGKRILDLLRSTNEGGGNPCRIITVAASKAQSAAAHILSAGDFAIADPGSRLLYHGSRIPLHGEVTARHASRIAENLKMSNNRFAASLLEKSARRFMFLIKALRPTFEAHRANGDGRTLTDLDCFHASLCQQASPAAQNVLRRAGAIWERHCGLLTHFQEEVAKVRLSSRSVDIEKIMLDASIAFEYENNKTDPEWSLRTGGLSRINEHFLYLDAYSHVTNEEQFATLRERWGPPYVANDDRDGKSIEEKAEKFQAFFLPLWSFFFALNIGLHGAENEITGMDAFWLGLIDTVRADRTASLPMELA
jgi:ATP-dependent protease ClpP protease subunit